MCEMVTDNLSDDLLWFADDVETHRRNLTTYQHGRIVQLAALLMGSVDLIRGLFSPAKGEEPKGEISAALFGIVITVKYNLSTGLSQVDWRLP